MAVTFLTDKDKDILDEQITQLSEEMVKSINGLKPDANGNIMLPIYNGEVADA